MRMTSPGGTLTDLTRLFIITYFRLITVYHLFTGMPINYTDLVIINTYPLDVLHALQTRLRRTPQHPATADSMRSLPLRILLLPSPHKQPRGVSGVSIVHLRIINLAAA
jgi:hypothetical protein